MGILYQNELDVKYDVDVFVGGGGPAGIAAAVAAARQGADVFIAESSGSFGGAATAMLVPAYMQFTDGEHFLAGGIGREIRDFIKDNVTDAFKPYCPDSIPVELLKLCCDKLVTESGARYSFFTNVIDVIAADGRIDYIVCSAKSGIFAVKAKVYIDCTGDGDICAMAGADYEFGDSETGEVMASTLCGLWSGIDWKRTSGSDARELDKAFEDGVFTNIDRHLPGMWRISNITGGSNAGHIYDVDSTDETSLTRAMTAARRQLLEYRRYYRDYLTGFENMELTISAPYIGIRESRRITGDYVMTLEDFKNRAVFDDEIGRYSYPVDIHSGKNTTAGYEKFRSEHSGLRYGKGESYGIPYRILTPAGIDNLLTAGRCVSTDRYMQSSIRVMPGCYITGQAAGVAAAQCAVTGKSVHKADVRDIQERLCAMGAYLPNYAQ